MKAQILRDISPVESRPLRLLDRPIPQPGPGEILVKISACGACHTELDEIEGRLQPKLPVILGHEIVGKVASKGSAAAKFKIGERVDIAWIHHACGSVFWLGQYEPGVAARWHRSDSIDYAFALSGEMWMQLDKEEVHLRTGDVVIQRGTVHNWVNREEKPCLMLYVLIATEEGKSTGWL